MIRDLFKSTMDKVMGRGDTGSPSAPRSVPYPFKYEARSAPKPAPAPPPQAVPMPAPKPAPVVEAAPEPVVEAAPAVEEAPAAVVEDAPAQEPVPEDAPAEDTRPLEAWTVKELRAELIGRGHELRSRARKSELLDLMRAELEADAASEEDGAEDQDAAAEATTDNAGGLDYDVLQELFDDMVRPALQADGGDISLIRVDGMDAHVRLVGACSTCPSSVMTMKLGVEALLKEEFPGFGSLIEV